MKLFFSSPAPEIVPKVEKYVFYDLPMVRKIWSFTMLQDIAFLKWTSLVTNTALIALVFVIDALPGNLYRMTLGNWRIERLNLQNEEKLKVYRKEQVTVWGSRIALCGPALGALSALYYYRTPSIEGQPKIPEVPPGGTNLVPWIGLAVLAIAAATLITYQIKKGQESSSPPKRSTPISKAPEGPVAPVAASGNRPSGVPPPPLRENVPRDLDAPVGIKNPKNFCWAISLFHFGFTIPLLKDLWNQIFPEIVKTYEKAKEKKEGRVLSAEVAPMIAEKFPFQERDSKQQDVSEALKFLLGKVDARLLPKMISPPERNEILIDSSRESSPVIVLQVKNEKSLQELLQNEKGSCENVPKDLFLQLQRYSNDKWEVTTESRVPLHMYMKKEAAKQVMQQIFPKENQFYQVFGYVKRGANPNILEPTVYIQDTKANCWFYCNNEEVKKISLEEVPKNLSSEDFVSIKIQKQSIQKKNDPTINSMEISLPKEFFSESAQKEINGEIPYEVDTFITRHGEDAYESGHYKAYVRSSNGQWYECNDQIISQSSEAQKVLQENGYLLHLKRK
jgi:hypothetical protein